MPEDETPSKTGAPGPRAVPVFPQYVPEDPKDGEWSKVDRIDRKGYVCGYCGTKTGSKEGWNNFSPTARVVAEIAICQHCNRPTYFESGVQVPSSGLGKPVDFLPDSVAALYEEARRSTTVGAYTGTLLLCRTLLMYVAVEKGATPGRDFPDYMNFLASKGHVPHGSKEWVERIIKKGGEAAHEVSPKDERDAEEILTFVEMLLRNVYEMPARAAKSKRQ